MRRLIQTVAVFILFFSFSAVAEESGWVYFLGKDGLTGAPEPGREFVANHVTILDSDGRQGFVTLAYYCSDIVGLRFGDSVSGRAFKRDYPVRLKFDGQPVITEWPILGEDRTSGWNRQADLPVGRDWKQLLKEHYEVRVEITPSFGLPVVAKFNLIGFSAEVAKCGGWRR